MAENKTIAQVVKDSFCTGCGTCIALCPSSAIKLTIDEKKGIYVPKIDEENCNNCGICFNVCPGHEVDFKGLNLEIFGKEPENILIGNYLNCYVGHSTDYDIRYNSASGGLVTQLLIFALEEGMIDGALVTRMKKDNPLEPEPFIARTKEEIIEASQSKYCPVPANIALKEILESEEGEKFAVVGLPCHIQGIRKAEIVNAKLKEKIILHMGLFCGHSPNFFATERLLMKKGIEKKNIKKLRYRGEGWFGGMTIYQKDSSRKFIDFFDYWGRGFGIYFFPYRCTLCCDGIAEFADISFGDATLPEIKKEDNIGRSIILSKAQIGDKILNCLYKSGLIKLERVGPGKVIESQKQMLNFKKKKLYSRNAILKLFDKKTLIYNTELLKPGIVDYLTTLSFYLLFYFSSTHHWYLLETYTSIKKNIVKFIRDFIDRYRGRRNLM